MSEVDTNQIPSPLAGISTPSPAPNADALSGNQADRFSSAAQPLQQPSTQQTPPAQPAPAPTPNKHELLGRFISHLRNSVEGKQTVYTPDPNTGQVMESVQPRKAGGLFRDLVVGAMAGMAASATAGNEHPSAAAGIGLGFTGAKNALDAQQDRARTQAQNSATSGFQQKQRLDQQTLQDAQVAHDTVSGLNIGHFIGHHTDSQISDYNSSANAVKDVLMNNGAQLADVEGNSQKGNGPSLMAAYNRDNSLMAAPDGFHRVASITYDTNGLQHDAASHKWVNADGSQLSDDEWNKRGTVSLIDVPNAAWGKSVSLPGNVIQSIAPNSSLVRDPKKQYSASVGSLFALGLKNKQQMINARTELYRVPKDANEISQWDQQRQDIQARMQSDPQSVTDDEKRFLAVKGPMIDRAKQQQAAAPVTVNDFKDAQNMLSSDNPKEASAAQDFFVTSLAGPNGDKIAAFIQANPKKFTADQVKTADSWVRKFGGIKGIEKGGGGSGSSDPSSTTKSYANEWVDHKSGTHYNLNDPILNMVEGNQDPTQLTKRSKTYNRDLQKANEYSFARYGKPFDVAQAQSDFKYATQKSTQDTLRLLRSLTGSDNQNNGGTLSQLETQFAALGNSQIPKLNQIENWASQNAGKPEVTNFASTLLGVSDEMGKILGGGVATDSSRKEAREILDKAFSGSQGRGAIAAVRGALANRQNALTENNRYLLKQFGQMSLPQAAAARVVPAGAVAGRDANGNIIGYRTADGKVTKF